jgi:hypothetical protein
LTSPPIGKAASGDALERFFATLEIIALARVVAEVELDAVAVQMLRAHVVVGADNAALEDAEIALDSVRVGRAAHVLASAVVHDLMLGGAVHVAILASVIGAERGRSVDLLAKDGLDVGSGDALHVSRANRAAALDQREDSFLAPATAETARGALALVAVLLLPPHERLVGFNGLTFATERRLTFGSLHRGPDAVRHEPRRFLRHSEHTGELVARHAALGRAKQEGRQHPLVKADLAALEQRADRHRVLLTAVIALDNAHANRTARMSLRHFARLRRKPLSVQRTTVRAKRTFRQRKLSRCSRAAFSSVKRGAVMSIPHPHGMADALSSISYPIKSGARKWVK